MCSNPLEISYSHIAEITLQDAPNVISQGFSTSICCQGETLTSNIMDFRLFPSLPASLLLFIPLLESVLSYSGWNSLPVANVVDVSSILGGGNETVLEKRPRTGRGGYSERVTLLLLINPGGKLGSSVLLHFIAKVFLSLDFPCFTYFAEKQESRWGNVEIPCVLLLVWITFKVKWSTSTSIFPLLRKDSKSWRGIG